MLLTRLGSQARRCAVALGTALLLLACLGAGSARGAITHTFAPSAPPIDSNCFPLGATHWAPFYGSIYRNLPAFNLNPNDILAFDLNAMNDTDAQLQIEMAATAVNGGDAPAGAFTTLVPNTQLPSNPRGNTVTGDYEMQFRSQSQFSFPGGGLILRFSSPVGAFATDFSCTPVFNDNLAVDTDPTLLFVKRFYGDADGLPPYSSDPDTMSIPAFRLTLNPPNSFNLGSARRNKKKGTATLPVTVPGPGTLALGGSGIKALTAGGGPSAGTAVLGAGTVELLIKPKGKKKRKLNETGKVKVKPTITYTPTGGDPATQSRKLKLKKG